VVIRHDPAVAGRLADGLDAAGGGGTRRAWMSQNGPRLGVSESMRHIEPAATDKPGRRYPAAGVRLWAGRPVIT
jgi:hypothetical protein